MGKKVSIKKWLFLSAAIGSAAIVSSITLTSCGVSKTILNNMVNKWAGGGAFSTNLSFDNVVQESALNKSGNTAFKNAVANDIALKFYQNVADGKYGDGVFYKKEFKDNLNKWNKQIDDAYDAKIKDYKSNHKYDWPYYFQNEVLDPVGGTKENWKLYDAQAGLCQYVTKDLITRAKEQNYMALPKLPSGSFVDNYNYDPAGDVETLPDINNESPTSDYLKYNGKLAPRFWNYINFFEKAGHYSEPENYLDQFYTALQREAFNEWLDNCRPISTSNVLWKYSVPSTNNRNLQTIYNTSETEASYAFPYFDDAPYNPGDDNEPTNYLFRDMYDKGFSDGATPSYKNFFYDTTTSDNTASLPLGLINIDTVYNDGGSSTLSLLGKDTYANASEFDGPAAYALWDAFDNSSGSPTGKVEGDAGDNIHRLIDGYKIRDPQSNSPRILGNFLSNGSDGTDILNFETTKWIDLSDWYGSNPDNICNVYNATSQNNEIKTFNWTINSFQLSDDDAHNNPLPYILYRGADGVHLVGLDGVSYLQAPTSDDRIGTGTNGFVSTNTQFSTVREGALLKFRALHDKKVKNPVAGTGLKIQDAFQSYMDSNFSDVLINTYYRTTHPDFANTHPWFGNANNKDASLDWKIDDSIKNMDDIWNYIEAFTNLFNLQSAISKYDDANKKLIAFGKKYADNMSNDEGKANTASKNGLAVRLPWILQSGVATPISIDSNTDYKLLIAEQLQSHYKENIHIFDGISEFNMNNLKQSVIGAFNTWKSKSDGIEMNISKSGSLKYSEHIFAKNHYVADMMWAALGDSSSKISNLERFHVYDKYLGAKDVSTDKYSVETAYNDQITSQYISSKLMSDDTSLPSYTNSGTGTDHHLTLQDYINVLEGRWNTKGVKDQSWSEHTSSEYIGYLSFLSRIKYLSDDNYAKLMKSLQDKVSQNASDILFRPSVIAWIDGDSFDRTQTDKSDYKFKDNYQNQYENRYVNTNRDAGEYNNDQRSWKSYPQYWQYAKLLKDDATTEEGMGFIGLQTKGKLNGLPDAAAAAIFDNFNKASNEETPFGSLYRFGSIDPLVPLGQKLASARDKFSSLLNTTSNLDALKSLLDSALPGELSTTNFGDATAWSGESWDNVKNDLEPTSPLTDDAKLQHLKDYLLANKQVGNPGEVRKGILWNEDALDGPVMNLFKPHNQTNSGGSYVFEPWNGVRSSYVFGSGTSNNGFKVCAVQVNYNDVTSWDNFKAAVGEDVAKSILIKAAMTTDYDNEVNKLVLKTAFGDNKKCEVYDRRFNDDADLKWLIDYKEPN